MDTLPAAQDPCRGRCRPRKTTTRARPLLALPLIPLISGCMFSGSKENLMEALREYNDGMRWARVEWMVPHVPQEDRDRLLASRLESEDLKVTGYDLTSVRLKDGDKAVVVVRVDWFHLRQARLHTSVIEQTWARDGQSWQVVKQRLTKGPPFPLIRLDAERQMGEDRSST